MNSKDLKAKYDKLVSEVASLRMYDGRNKGVDVYVCEDCKETFYTEYKDKGVTPFVIKCRNEKCKGSMIHKHTISKEQASLHGKTIHNWIRPTFEQFLKLSEGAQDHILNGGLMLEDELK